MRLIHQIKIFLLILLCIFFTNTNSMAADAQEAKKILSIEAYDMLNTVPDTYLIDVRTRAEYQFVGQCLLYKVCIATFARFKRIGGICFFGFGDHTTAGTYSILCIEICHSRLHGVFTYRIHENRFACYGCCSCFYRF